jgi:hypothetical protein
MAVLSSSSSTEEWYVGINGVPVGPVRLADLRRKAANGLITEESLVWREGFEEWVPLRTFPELTAMLKESATAGRTSLTPTPGTAAPIPPSRAHAPLPRGPVSPAGSGIRPSVTPRGVASQPRSNVLAFAARGATAEKIDGLGEPSLEEQVKFDESVRPPPPAAPDAAPVPAAPVLPGFGPIGSRRQLQHAHAAKGARTIGLVICSAGCSSAWAPWSCSCRDRTAETRRTDRIGDGARARYSGAGGGRGGTRPSAPSGEARRSGGLPPGTKGKGAAAEPASPGAIRSSLTGLGGLVGGPSAPSGGSTSSGGGGQLQAADVERVVQSHRAFVKRQCWEPALGAKAPNSPSSARVVVSINVAKDGSVPSVTTTGGDGYPGLASCVQGQVTKWKFPPSDGSTVTVPFVFAAQ